MNAPIDAMKRILEQPSMTADDKQRVGHLLDAIQKQLRVLDFKVEKVSRDKTTLTTLLNRTSEDLEHALQQIEAEQEKSERLLLNILPASIAKRLKDGQQIIADAFEETTVLFSDIVGFTMLSERMPPEELVVMLNMLFSAFDDLTEKHGLEKIKTIGDAYMVAAGLPDHRTDHAQAIAAMAIDMCQAMRTFNTAMGHSLQIRIGINSGAVVAGVIGKKKFIYDLWGDAVNTAARMESHGIPGEIQVSQATYELLKDTFEFEERGQITVKGKGSMRVYLLKERGKRKEDMYSA